MKIIHILKRLDEIDKDIKELKKMEKSLQQNKSFSEPIYISIEQQINLLLGQKIKCLELEIHNPPEALVKDIYGTEEVKLKPLLNSTPGKKSGSSTKARKKSTTTRTKAKKASGKTTKATKASKKEDNFEKGFLSIKPQRKTKPVEEKSDFDNFDPENMALKMLTQNDIDKKFEKLKAKTPASEKVEPKKEVESKAKEEDNAESVKLLDIALQKGSLNKEEIQKEKKKVRFFRDNFPGGEY